jgi:carbamoyltransferase
MIEMVVKAPLTRQAVGWLGPHGVWSALARCTLDFGDPRSPTMQRNLNLKVKYREPAVRAFGIARGCFGLV